MIWIFPVMLCGLSFCCGGLSLLSSTMDDKAVGPTLHVSYETSKNSCLSLPKAALIAAEPTWLHVIVRISSKKTHAQHSVSQSEQVSWHDMSLSGPDMFWHYILTSWSGPMTRHVAFRQLPIYWLYNYCSWWRHRWRPARSCGTGAIMVAERLQG